MSKKKLMVALVGGQPLPNVLPIRAFKPEAALLVYTSGTEAVYRRLESVLKNETSIFPLLVDAYDIPAIAADLDSRLREEDLHDYALEFNMTGGTKAMTLAAYQMAEQRQAPLMYLQSEGRQSRIYRYVWEQGQLQKSADDPVSPSITIDEFLTIHLGGKDQWSQLGPNRDKGGPFERAIGAALRLHFDEVRSRISLMRGQIELDVVVRAGDQFGVIEAKSGNKGASLDGIRQLGNSGAGRYLGTYTQPFYVITVPLSYSHEEVVAVSRIKVISLPGYVEGSETLSDDDAKMLVDKVREGLGLKPKENAAPE